MCRDKEIIYNTIKVYSRDHIDDGWHEWHEYNGKSIEFVKRDIAETYPKFYEFNPSFKIYAINPSFKIYAIDILKKEEFCYGDLTTLTKKEEHEKSLPYKKGDFIRHNSHILFDGTPLWYEYMVTNCFSFKDEIYVCYISQNRRWIVNVKDVKPVISGKTIPEEENTEV